MATLKKTVDEAYYWSINRMCELCARGNFEDVMDGDSIRQEFDEWIMAENKNSEEDIISCLLYTSDAADE